MRKGFAPILILILVLVIGLVGYFVYKNNPGLVQRIALVSPSTVGTSNWKTYTNSDFGILFKYPSNLKVFEFPTIISLGAEGTGGLIFEVHKDQATTIKALFEKDKLKFNEYIRLNESAPILKDSEINGYSGQETLFKAAVQGVDIRVIYFQKGEDVIRIFLNPRSDSTSNQILSTFRFTETNTSKISECLAKTSCKGATPCMANPASVFCTCMGGESKIKETDKGQSGICKIDGNEYDEWEYFRKYSSS